MPQLWTRHIDATQLRLIAPALIKELAEICSSTEDNFTIEIISGDSIGSNELIAPFAFIEVRWFDRGIAVQNRFAESVTKQLLTIGIREIEMAFIPYEKRNYYCNGVAFE